MKLKSLSYYQERLFCENKKYFIQTAKIVCKL